MRRLSKVMATKSEAKLVDWECVIEKGTVLKKKLGSKKWEQRFAILTKSHLVWFEVRNTKKSKDLDEVTTCFSGRGGF